MVEGVFMNRYLSLFCDGLNDWSTTSCSPAGVSELERGPPKITRTMLSPEAPTTYVPVEARHPARQQYVHTEIYLRYDTVVSCSTRCDAVR